MSYNGAGTLRPGINAFRHFTLFHFILLNNQGANRKSTNCFLCLLVNENAFHLCILSWNVKRAAVFIFRPHCYRYGESYEQFCQNNIIFFYLIMLFLVYFRKFQYYKLDYILTMTTIVTSVFRYACTNIFELCVR